MTVSPDPDADLRAASGRNVLVTWLRSHARVAERWRADVPARRA
ncbi:hypothetical protein [Pseudonocardia yunnanensis]